MPYGYPYPCGYPAPYPVYPVPYPAGNSMVCTLYRSFDSRINLRGLVVLYTVLLDFFMAYADMHKPLLNCC